MENKSSGRGRSSTGANRASSRRGSSGAQVGSGRLGAIPKTCASSNQRQWREHPPSSTSIREISRGRGIRGPNFPPHHSRPRQTSHRRLDFQYLVRLASDNIEPSDVIRCLGDPENDLAQHIKENLGNVEYLELVVVALGRFCQKNGNSQFSESFVAIVKILAAQNFFQHITSTIINIPISRAVNLLAKEERLKRLTSAVFHLATEILVMMPALACQCLGQHFFTDIISLKAMPSIKNMNVVDAFDIFEGGIQQLETAWNQHIPVEIKKDDHLLRMEEYRDDLALQDPPDNFRTLKVVPTWEDVCLDVEPFLRPNIVKGAYPDVTTYLDVQFRLLREDFFYPLRLGLLAYKNQTDRKHSRMRNPDNIRLYYGVEILEYDLHGDTYIIQFSNAHLKKINWTTSKRFIYGSLLCLSSDNFASFHLFTVADRDIRLLFDGKIKVKFEGGFLSASLKKQIFVMAESTVFFESYRTILMALQRISPTNFPLEDYILGRKSSPEMPEYLLKTAKPIYDLTYDSFDLPRDEETRERILEKRRNFLGTVDEARNRRLRIQQVEILEPSCRPGGNDLGLDPSQCAALYVALTQKISVIQGPPGTGKTYLGLRIVQTLLTNKHFWMDQRTRSSPILVICYTNHALDQFLEGIAKFTRQIVRIGSQSKCAALEPFSLMAWKKRPGYGAQHETKRWIFDIRDKLREYQREQEFIRSVMIVMNSRGLIHQDSLLEMRIIPEMVHSKFGILMTSFRYGRGYNNVEWTALGIWLQLNWTDGLEQLVNSLKQTDTNARQIVSDSCVTDKLVEETGDDEWDKEHIDEIQAFRKVEEEDYLASFKEHHVSNQLKLENNSNNRFSVKFCYEFSETDAAITKYKESLDSVQGEDITWMSSKIKELQKQLFLLRQLLQGVPTLNEKQLNELYKYELMQIPLTQRWMMYNSWKVKALEIHEERAAQLEKLYLENANRLKDVRNLESAEICQKADIVGFTTTGAAKQRALLNHLKPKIVVVEEAAEVLESHVVCALSTSCQQLVLIGDHQQLRPPVTVHRLAKDFFLDVSLFERLIKNGMEPCVLGVQHRMRPEIARLIVPSIYPTLENHASVLDYPGVRGMASNVFFLTHTEQEIGDHEGKSHLNPYEAELSLALARHLIMQGYSPTQITILTTYSGQLLHFFKIRRNHSAAQSVRISVVDNFQGEENDIIILSLVRSNVDENIGFLRIENRICVALSRAKHGFYMIGNMDNLQGKSKLWKGISRILDSDGQIGPDFGLRCDIHDIQIKARKVTDFPPEGGCMNKCSSKMLCGHICPMICHANDRTHALFKCQEKCTRFCPVGHPCPKKCFENCNPCVERVTKTLPCTHEQVVLCHKDPNKEFCQTSVWKILPGCGHGMDLLCGLSLSEAVCPEMCGMTLDCGHICPLHCHKRSPHDKIKCRQPCERTCPDQHLCKKKCFEDCGKCFTKMKKILPCGHESEVECSQNLADVDCSVKVIKVLTSCEHSVAIECGKSTEGYKCKKPCEKMLCEDEHFCKKLCFEPCGRCHVRMKREFKCGHTTTMECFVDPSNVKCRVPKECVLPLCGHQATIPCGQDPVEGKCPLPCDVRLDCGHTCTLKCHVQNNPDHQNYQCKKECGRMKQGCKKEHRCGKKCFEECILCNEKWKRTLSCGHDIFTECHRNDDNIFCSKSITKIIPECGHKIELPCSTEPIRSLCKEMCASKLPCGHLCKKKCCEPCDQADCSEPMTTTKVNICGHHVTLTCHSYYEVVGVPTESQIQSHLTTCMKPCKATLDCEHLCKGTCGECFNGRVHRACDQKCGRSLVCGHICNVNCGLSCPPCRQKCEYSCSHSKCRHMCCEPCRPCQELCKWSCEHKTCKKKCGEPCSRTRCDEPCKKRLSCGHSCAGLCGEICPPLCRVCDKDKLTEFTLLGNEDDEDAKFVYLPDCQHCIEVEGMDKWMETDGGGQIQRKCCPRCKAPIKICMRYGDIIKSTFDDIAKAKKIIFLLKGDPLKYFENIAVQLLECRRGIKKCDPLQILKTIENNLGILDQQVEPKLNGKKKKIYPAMDSDMRFLIEVKVDFFARVIDLLKKINPKQLRVGVVKSDCVRMKPELIDEFCGFIQKLFRSLMERVRVSTNEYRALTRELDRLDYVGAYFVLKSSPSFPVVGVPSPENELIQRLLMKNILVLEDGQKLEIKAAMKALGVKLRTGIGITDTERREVVQAMGLKQGHWFKCPNGHIYAIGDCGGASVESRCNECHARIGGTNHRLLGDNRFAGEMDNAARPAWPGTTVH